MKKPKRRLIASFFFDLNQAENSMYMPTITIYWLVGEKEKPIQINVKYNWQDFSVSYPYKNFIRIKSIVKHVQWLIEERTRNYGGDFDIDMDEHFYLSEFGTSVYSSKSQDQVEGWIKKWVEGIPESQSRLRSLGL